MKPVLTPEEFVHEVQFAVLGMQAHGGNPFPSLAQQTNITIDTSDSQKVMLGFHLDRNTVVDNVHDAKKLAKF